MRDIRVVQAKALLKVSSVAPVRNFSPPAIVILGERFNTANEITYNGIEVSEFIIAAPTRIIARIPDSQVGQALRDLRVMAPVSIAKLDAQRDLGVGSPVRTVEGIDRLVQEWLLIFLTNPGSDIFNQTGGGGARAVIGQPASSSESNAVSELSLAVEKTKQQLLRQQAQNSNIPPAERLLSASLSDVRFDQQTTSLTAVVDIKNVLGGSASVTVG
jgi:hypothetical protein